MSALLTIAVACWAAHKGYVWLLALMCVAVVILPPKWNPAFWHLVKPGTGEIRPNVKIKHPLGFD